MSHEDIAKFLKKDVIHVSNYVEAELNRLQDAAIQQAIKEAAVVSEEVYDATVALIATNTKFTNEKSRELLNRTINKLPPGEYTDSGKLYRIALKNMNAKDVMLTTTVGGRSGITVMTGAASEKTDANKKIHGYSRSSNGNIFHPKDNRMNNE